METTWRGGISGARALVVDDGRCALIGGYGEHRNRVVVGSFTPDGFEPDTSGVLSLSGAAEPGACRLVTRGAELHAFVGLQWYKVSLADLSK